MDGAAVVSIKPDLETHLDRLVVVAKYALWVVVATAVLYLGWEYAVQGWVSDLLFVAMVTAATMILLFGARSFFHFVIDGIDDVHADLFTGRPDELQRRCEGFCASIMNVPWMLAAGVVYGLVIASSPLWLSGVWIDHPDLRFPLMIFLFAVNLVTGASLYSLILFFRRVAELGPRLRFSLWETRDFTTGFLLEATHRLSVLASVYVGLCISSVAVSEFNFGTVIIVYASLASLLILASLVVPVWPIVRRVKALKAEALRGIDGELQELHRTILKSGASAAGAIEEWNKIRSYREQVAAISPLPYKHKTVQAGTKVIFFSLLPMLLQKIPKIGETVVQLLKELGDALNK